MRFRTLVVALWLAAALPLARCLWQSAQAANPPVDAGLLEFLGSVDSDDEDWHQYLRNGGATAARRVPGDPVDPASGGGAGNAGASTHPPPDAHAPNEDPPPQQSAPAPSQAGSSSAEQSTPPEVNDA